MMVVNKGHPRSLDYSSCVGIIYGGVLWWSFSGILGV